MESDGELDSESRFVSSLPLYTLSDVGNVFFRKYSKYLGVWSDITVLGPLFHTQSFP